MIERIAKEGGAPEQHLDEKIKEMDKKLNLLLDAFLNQVVSEDEYKVKKAALLNNQIKLKESVVRRARYGERWLELSQDFLTTAGQAAYVAKEGPLEEKRAFIKKIGSNFRLARRKLALTLHFPYFQIAQNPVKANWGRRRDLNPRHLEPQSSALPS